MPVVAVTLPQHRYEVRIERGLLERLGDAVKAVAPHARCGLFADANVDKLHGDRAAASLTRAGYAVTRRPVTGGEDHKNVANVAALYPLLVENRLERKSPILALGGGIIGDSIGFLAATYLRGVPFIQCPTSLLAMVDASVGGKVGVNLPQGKNLVGAFHQPHLVAIDTDTLKTLPRRELLCGLAECVKHGVIRDPDKFAWLESNLDAILALDPDTLVELVRWNVQIKATVVMADEKETGERAHLNYGHTFAHAIEAMVGYGPSGTGTHNYEHGEAVSLGMIAATRLAADARRCPHDLVDRLTKLLTRIGLPTRAPNLPPTERLMESMRVDKKVAAGRIRLVLPDRLGAVSIVSDTPDSAIIAAWDSLRG